MNGRNLEHAAKYAEEELNTATDNARSLLPLTEDFHVQVYHPNQDFVTPNRVQVSMYL